MFSPNTLRPVDLGEEFQSLPQIDLRSVNPYDLAILRVVVARAVESEGLGLKTPISMYQGKLIITTDTRGHSKDAIVKVVKTRLTPFVTPIDSVDVYSLPDNVTQQSQSATGMISAENMKPDLLNGSTIDYDKTWARCVEVAEGVDTVDLDGATISVSSGKRTIMSKWATAPYAPKGFVSQEQLTIGIVPDARGKTLVFTIDTKLRLRRESSRPWIIADLDSGSLGITDPRQSMATQDKCLVALSKALKR
jgi:hypothetical protein